MTCDSALPTGTVISFLLKWAIYTTRLLVTLPWCLKSVLWLLGSALQPSTWACGRMVQAPAVMFGAPVPSSVVGVVPACVLSVVVIPLHGGDSTMEDFPARCLPGPCWGFPDVSRLVLS